MNLAVSQTYHRNITGEHQIVRGDLVDSIRQSGSEAHPVVNIEDRP